MGAKEIFRQAYQKKFDELKKVIIQRPVQGWIKTLREFLGMTTTQLAHKIGVSQPRVIAMEKNEKNIKISTMEKIADELNCDFVYAFVPRENINDVLYNQAKKKAMKILNKVNTNMALENQLSKNNNSLDELIKELMNENSSRLWEED